MYTGWKYHRPITDANSTSVSDYELKVVLNASNFDFSKAKSDGADIRFADLTDEIELFYHVESYDAQAESAVIWVRVRDITHDIAIYYGNPLATTESCAENAFHWADSFAAGNDGDRAPCWALYDVLGTPDADDYIKLSRAQGKTSRYITPKKTKEIWDDSENGTGLPYGPSRTGAQRSTFTSNGRYWQVFTKYTSAANNFDLCVTSTPDGDTWTDPVTFGKCYTYDAQWSIYYDDVTGRVHIISYNQAGSGGLTYRCGTPNADGSISWLADWQTVSASPSSGGDPEIAVDTAGHAWVTVGNGTTAHVDLYKNANIDGTWDDTDGFPLDTNTVTSYTSDGAILCPLLSGGMYIVFYKFGATNLKVKGAYSADGSASLTAEDNISLQNITPDEQGPGSISALGHNGHVYIVYRDTVTSNHAIRFLERDADGNWLTERVLYADSTNGNGQNTDVPTICIVGDDDIFVAWESSDTGGIYATFRSNGVWLSPRKVYDFAKYATGNHLQLSKHAPDGKVQATLLRSDQMLCWALFDWAEVLRGGDTSVSQALEVRRTTTTIASTHYWHDWQSGYRWEGDFYLDAMKAGQYVGIYWRETNTGNIGPFVCFMGTGPAIGHRANGAGGPTAVSGFAIDSWNTWGVEVTGSGLYSLYLNGGLAASGVQFFQAPSTGTLTEIRPLTAFDASGNLYLDNLRVRRIEHPEPLATLGAEVGGRARLIGGGLL